METIAIASVVNFVVAFSIVFMVARKPAAKFLEKRSIDVGAQMVEADAQRKVAEAELAQWETQWKTSAQQAKDQLEDAKLQVKKMREQVLELARKEAERLGKDAKQLVGSEVRKAKLALCREVGEKSVHLAGQYLGMHLKEEDRNKLASEYVEKVSNGHAG